MAWLTNRPIGLTYKGLGAFPGYTLFCSVSGHHATMVDMDGQVVHQWHHDEGIQHLKLLNNGNLLIQTQPSRDAGGRETSGGAAAALVELSESGDIVSEHRDVTQHHDYVRLDNGNTAYLAWERIPEEISSRIQGGHSLPSDKEFMWGDVVREVNPKGEIVRQWLSWEHLDVDEDVICPLEGRKEWTHANSLEVLENGDWLISFRLTSTVAIIDRELGGIKWRWSPKRNARNHDHKKLGPAELSHQHNAQMLSNGNILVFDNGCHRKRGPSYSRIVEIDRHSREFVWIYEAEVLLAFNSFMAGGCERQPNGNTLITEGASGRIFEVTQDGRVVWEYVSPWSVPSKFGPSPALFRSYRIAVNDPRLKRYNLSPKDYSDLNASIASGQVQAEPDYDHVQ